MWKCVTLTVNRSIQNGLIRQLIQSNVHNQLRSLSAANPIATTEKSKKTSIPINLENTLNSDESNFQRGSLNSEILSYYFYNLARHMQSKKLTFELIESDENFKNQCDKLSQLLKSPVINSVSFSTKLTILRSLQSIGLSGNDYLVEELIASIIKSANSSYISNILNFLVHQLKFQQTDNQRELIVCFRDLVVNNLDKVKKIEMLIDFYKLSGSGLFSKETLNQMDELAQTQILVEIQTEKPKPIAHLLSVISSSRRRPKPLIKLLTFSLRNSDIRSLNINHLCNLIQSLSSLHMPDFNILNAVCDQLIQKNFAQNVTNADIEWVLKSLVRLRYKPIDLLIYLDGILRTNNQPTNTKVAIDYIVACAKLNHKLTDLNEILPKDETLNKLINSMKPIEKLEFGWARVFHDDIDSESLNELFSEKFLTKLFQGKEDASYFKSKLLQIAFDQKVKGNIIQVPSIVYDYEPISSRNPEMIGLVAEDLENLISKNHLLTNVKNDFGCHLNFVFALDENFKSVGFPTDSSFEKMVELLKPNQTLVCLMVKSYKDFLLNTHELIGEHQLPLNLSLHPNVKLFCLSKDNYNESTAAVNRIRHLKNIIENLIKQH